MPRFFSRIGPAAWALALFVALSVLFFWPLWASNPADHMTIGARGDDFIRQFYPYRAFVADTWASGRLPLWNPHQYAGTPTWADPQQAVVYPWRLLQAPLAIGDRTLPLWSVELEAVLHVALAGWFTYLLLRRLRSGALGAVFGGIVYAFGGYLTGYPLVQLAVLDTAVWVPATLWGLAATFDAARDGIRAEAARWTAVAAVAAALLVLAGHPQTAAYGFAAGIAWWAWSVARSKPPRYLMVWSGLLWLALAIGLSAVQWLPSAALTDRLADRFEEVDLLAGLARIDVAQLLVPGVITQWSPLFVGALAAITVLWGLWRCRATWFWAGLAAVAWLVAMGGNTPVLPVLLRVVPGVDMFRHHERAAVIFSIALAVAAGLSLQHLLSAPRRQQLQAAGLALGVAGLSAFLSLVGTARAGLLERTLNASEAATWRGSPADALALTALVLVAFGVVLLLRWQNRLSVRATSVALVAVALFELFSVNQGRALAPAYEPESDPILAALVPHQRDGRVSSEALLHDGPNAASLHGLYDTTGDSPIRLAAYDDLAADTTEIERWGLLGVRYVVSDRAFPPDAPVLEKARDGDRVLYETQIAAPMTWVTDDHDGDAGDTGAVNAAGAVGEARLVGMDPGRLVVEAELPDGGGVVVVSTVYDPGWRVSGHSLDTGAEMPFEPWPETGVVGAYGGVMAVRALEPGRWQVEWTYRPVEVIVGISLSLLSLLLGVMLWRPRWLRRK